MQIRLLGEVDALASNGSPVEVAGRKERSLLAFLALRAGAPVAQDVLLDAIWPSSDPSPAARSLHVRVANLRRALGPDAVVRSPVGYALDVESADVDALLFAALIDEGDPAAALALWRGDPLGGVHDEWAVEERRRLEDIHVRAREDASDARLDAGEGAQLVPELEQLVRAEPLRERPRELLMRALYRAGRQAEALEVYRDGRRVLDEELGVEPGPRLRELERSILNHDAALDGRTAPPRRKRRAWLVALAVVALCAVAAAAVAATRGSAAPRVEPNSVGVLDAGTGRIVADLPVGRRPIAVAAGLGAIWVANAGDSTVTRIDPRTLETSTFGLGAPPVAMSVGDGAVWVATHGPSIVELASSGGTTEIPVGRTVSAVAAGPDGIWVATHGVELTPRPRLVLLDPSTHAQLRALTLNATPTVIVAAGGTTWFPEESAASFSGVPVQALTSARATPATLAVLPPVGIYMSAGPKCAAVAAGSLWAPAAVGSSVWRIGSNVGDLSGVRTPERIACATSGAGVVWLSGLDGGIYRLDPASSTVTLVRHTGATLSGIATGFGRVWVTAG